MFYRIQPILTQHSVEEKEDLMDHPTSTDSPSGSSGGRGNSSAGP